MKEHLCSIISRIYTNTSLILVEASIMQGRHRPAFRVPAGHERASGGPPAGNRRAFCPTQQHRVPNYGRIRDPGPGPGPGGPFYAFLYSRAGGCSRLAVSFMLLKRYDCRNRIQIRTMICYISCLPIVLLEFC